MSEKLWTPRLKKRLTPGKRAVVIMIIVALLVGLGTSGYRYLQEYYPATATAKEAILGGRGVVVEEEEDYYFFAAESDTAQSDFSGKEEMPGKEELPGIIFYPGGKVDEAAYAPMLCKLARSGYEVYLMRMPFHLAVFRKDAADLVIGGSEQKREWILMGHSLGGSMAADYAAGHSDQVVGLVLLGAYSTSDLSGLRLSVLSIYGDKDGVMDRGRYEKYKKNLPEDTLEHVIEGGNHSGYGYYGVQDGDGEAEITPEEQQEEVVDLVIRNWR